MTINNLISDFTTSFLFRFHITEFIIPLNKERANCEVGQIQLPRRKESSQLVLDLKKIKQQESRGTVVGQHILTSTRKSKETKSNVFVIFSVSSLLG